MKRSELIDLLERSPVIAAVADSKWDAAVSSPAGIIFYLQGNLLTLKERVNQAHKASKPVFVHIDLAEGIARDKTGLAFMAECGVDGILTTHGNLIKSAREIGLFTVQRFFALDSKGIENVEDIVSTVSPDLIEIMPGIAYKIVSRFSSGKTPVIAGGLIETKNEVTQALSFGATAVSTGCEELWYL